MSTPRVGGAAAVTGGVEQPGIQCLVPMRRLPAKIAIAGDGVL